MVVVLVTLQRMTKVTEKIILRKNLMNKNVIKNSRIVLISYQEIKENIKKVRKIVKISRKSPVKSDDNLQPQVQQSFGKEKVSFWSAKLAGRVC